MAQSIDYVATDHPSTEIHPAQYHRGDMSVEEHQATYVFFNALVHRGSLAIATLLSFFVLLLCAHAGVLPSAVVAVIIAGGGTVWLRRPKAH